MFFSTVRLNVSSNCFLERRHSRIGCICLIFLHCASLNVSSNHLPESRHSRIGCICLTFLHCGSLNVSLNCMPKRMFVWFFSTVLATAPMTGNGFSPLWATNFLQCVLKSKIIIPRPSSVPSSVKRPAHWLQSYLIWSSLLRNSLWKTDKIVIFDIMEKGESSHFTGGKSVKRRGESWPK